MVEFVCEVRIEQVRADFRFASGFAIDIQSKRSTNFDEKIIPQNETTPLPIL